MHQLSFISKNPEFTLGELRFSFQVFTFENLYEPAAGSVTVSEESGSCRILAKRLYWAGGQQSAGGSLKAEITKSGETYRFSITAAHDTERIRCVKLTLLGLSIGNIANLRQPATEASALKIPADGLILKYPDGFAGLYTPLTVMQQSPEQFVYFRSLDSEVRPKIFTFLPRGDVVDVELIFEQDARRFCQEMEVPLWEVGRSGQYDSIMEEQHKWIQETYCLKPWQMRDDVPSWAKKISLVVSVHCQHWTGYVFNTYDDVLKNLRRIAKEVDAESILAYLPGWEGRYYYQYGDFRPCPRLGGEKGFRRLMRGAKDLGVHIMPMFMINGANPCTEDFTIWGESSLYVSPGGFPQIWGSCDWDTSRHYDHNCGLPLNPGAPLWQDRLVGQVLDLLRKFDFDGVFMDLAAVYVNDRRFDPYQGAVDIARRIRTAYPNVLMAGEGWYDALSVAYPLTQPSLTPQGDCRWSDRPYEELFCKSNRAFAHLGMGDLSRGSNGVFETGYNLVHTVTPLREGIIPTITIVDETLDAAWEQACNVFDQAKEYQKRYL